MKLKSLAITTSGLFSILVVISPLLPTHSRAAAPVQSSEITRSFDFRNGTLGWLPDFVGYTQFNQDTYEMVAEIRPLPTELGINGTGFFFQGHNRCDCLGMFLKRRLSAADGIVAGQRYQLNYTVRLASKDQTGCIGAGGAPGESVGLYFGGAQIEPTTFVGPYDTKRLNVESTVASLAGNIANGQPCDLSSTPYISIERQHQHTTEVTADNAGNLWLFVGTGSGFEGLTKLYYLRIDVVLSPVGSPQPNPINPPTLLTEGQSQTVLALNAITSTREPFPFYTRFLSGDERTYIMLFATNTELIVGESNATITVLAEDDRGLKFQLPVDSVHRVPNFDWLTQIVVRLPGELIGATNVRVSFNLRGASSNQAAINLISN